MEPLEKINVSINNVLERHNKYKTTTKETDDETTAEKSTGESHEHLLDAPLPQALGRC